jgi:hypothetical protein
LVHTLKEQTLKKYYFPALLALVLLSIAPLSAAQDHYGPVRRGQDLWDIASQVAYQHYQDADVSHTQVMLALLAQPIPRHSPRPAMPIRRCASGWYSTFLP